MTMQAGTPMQAGCVVQWELADVRSPHLAQPVPVVVARDIPYFANSNRFQTLNLYLPHIAENLALVGTPANSLPAPGTASLLPHYYVHIHGGAWRDPQLTATSIEPTAAHIFSGGGSSSPILAIASINYTLSQFPTHPTLPYDAIEDNHSDPAREAMHPKHVSDVLHAFGLLRSFGLTDGSYILSGHSCGACIAFQAILHSPQYYGLSSASDAPVPAALLGLNGLYDLPNLVHALDEAHEHLREDYDRLLSNAFGSEQSAWLAASPSRFDPAALAERVQRGKAPSLVMLEQSAEDQLVPMSQERQFEAALAQVEGVHVVRGQKCSGKHAAAWEEGIMMWESIQDVLQALQVLILLNE